MNDDLLKQVLRRIGVLPAPERAQADTGHFGPGAARKVFSSPLMDTLTAVSGGGSPDADYAPRGSKVLGMRATGSYTPGLDVVSLTGNVNDEKRESQRRHLADSRVPRAVLTHEMGHRRYFRGDDTPALMVDQGYVYKEPSGDDWRAMSDKEKRAHFNVNDYYRKNRIEGYAQAFANAFGFLDDTRKNPNVDFARKAAAESEGNTPGMGRIVAALLKTPEYSQHPLQGQIFR